MVVDINNLILIDDIKQYIRENGIDQEETIQELISKLAEGEDVPF